MTSTSRNLYTLFGFCVIVSCLCKNVSSEKQVDNMDELYLQNIADWLSDNLNRTNNEELGAAYIKVGFGFI